MNTCTDDKRAYCRIERGTGLFARKQKMHRVAPEEGSSKTHGVGMRCVELGIFSLLACGLSQTAAALTIIGNYDGTPFTAVPYFTCGPNWNCADPATHSTPVAPTANWVTNAFDAAARYWEERIADPWTVTVNYGFGFSQAGTGHFIGGASTDGRLTTGTITFNSAPHWFLSANPQRNDEYQVNVTRQTLPLGSPTGLQVTTGLTATAIPFGPASVPTVTCNGVPCGARQDLMSGAIHELAHALNLDTGTLSRSNTLTIRAAPPTLGLMRIPDGPLAGTTLPWTSGGGGHPFLKPSPGAIPFSDPNNPTPPEYSDTRLNSPSGDPIANGFFFYGAHRRLVTDLDAVLIATVSNFRRVNLSGLTYVALPNFADTTTLRPEAGGQSSLLAVNGAATLGQTANAAGNLVTALQLTPDALSQAGSAFLTLPFNINDRAIRSHFRFRIDPGAEGLAFVMQSSPQGNAAIGGIGGFLGLGGATGIGRSIAFALDTRQGAGEPNDNRVAVIVGGNTLATHATPSLRMASGDVLQAWIEYDPDRSLWRVFLAEDGDAKPSLALLSYVFATDFIPGQEAFVGFTGATGDIAANAEILSWDLTLESVVVGADAPATLALFFVGLSLFAVTRLRRRWCVNPDQTL